VDVNDHRWGTRSLKIRVGGRVVEPVHRNPIRGLPGNGLGLAEKSRGQHVALAAGYHLCSAARNAQNARRFRGRLGYERQFTFRRDAGLLDQGVGGGVDIGDLPGVQSDGMQAGLPELIFKENDLLAVG